MSTERCPEREELQRFVRCTLPERKADAIGEHLDVCPECEETVQGLERGGDTVAQCIRGALEMPTFTREPECERMMASLLENGATRPSDSDSAAPEASAKDLAAGAFVRDYEIVSKLGEGGMGAVYKAVHRRLKRTVAVKVLADHRLGDRPVVARFEREMSVLGQLNHPNIVAALDAGEHDGRHYLVMEYVEGRDLGEVVRSYGPLPIGAACQAISQAAEGLQYAHEHGYVHRDIKPSNLMLAKASRGGGQATVKILDLGLARAFESTEADVSRKHELTTAGQVMGTLDYMAPEQGGDAHEVDIRADIYSLGATLFKLLTGESPFAEHAKKPWVQRMIAIAQSNPPDIRTKREEIPDRLANIVHKMMAKDPSQRFAAPAEAAEALAPYAAGGNLEALLEDQTVNGSVERSPTKTMAGEAASTHRRSNKRLLTAAVGFAALALLAAVLVIFTRHGVVEVSSPDGKLPDDVKVVVSQGGEAIELLHADNQWSARIVNGEYHVELRGGEDRFEIKNSELTISRLGTAVVLLAIKPAQGMASPAQAISLDAPAVDVRTGIAKNRPEKLPIVQASVTDSSVELQAPRPPIAPAPETNLPDRAKPFVMLDADGKVLGEYKFFTEILALSQGDLIVEVHGNGPFPLPKIERSKNSLSIRAGEGYRPRFIASYEAKDEGLHFWFDILDADLELLGCDFVGKPVHRTFMFHGYGRQWTIDGCRLILSFGGVEGGGVISFQGERIAIRNSLVAGQLSEFAPLVNCELANNLLYRHVCKFAPVNNTHRILLASNTQYWADWPFIFVAGSDPSWRCQIAARDNSLLPFSESMAVTHPVPLAPNDVVQWKGEGNRRLAARDGDLWPKSPEEKSAFTGLKTIDDWNAYWGNAGDMRLAEWPEFEWSFFSQPDWRNGAQRFQEELAAARKQHPNLKVLGPDMELVGAGEAYDRLRTAPGSQPQFARPDPLEEGPFVIVRDDEPVKGFIGLGAAVAEARSGDVIEVRSDGEFRMVNVNAPPEKQLTLRAGRGYRPVFAHLWLPSGDWTLEGLQCRQAEDAHAPLNCMARRIANCSILHSPLAPSPIFVTAPPNHAGPVEIVNCYLPQGISAAAPHVQIGNTVTTGIAATFEGDCRVELSRSILWSHPSPRRSGAGCFGQQSAGTLHLHLADCLIDTDMIVNTGGEVVWQGERNLYRVHSGLWGAFKTPEGQTEKWRRTLEDWQAIWNSDADSEFDDSVLLRPEMWGRR